MNEFYKIGGVGVMGYISPMSTDDTYAVIDPLYGIDGFRNVDTMQDMLEIPEERRRAGMIVGVDGGQKYYKLKDIEWKWDITDWSEVSFNNIVHIDKEIPTGLIDDNNTIFELSSEPILNSEHVYLNGLLQENGEDYIMDGKSIVFSDSPMFGKRIRCSYRSF
jgi:hypothetical protein